MCEEERSCIDSMVEKGMDCLINIYVHADNGGAYWRGSYDIRLE